MRFAVISDIHANLEALTEVLGAVEGQKVDRVVSLVEASRPQVLLIDCSAVPDLEYTALKMLIEAEKRQRDRGVTVWLVGLNPEVLSVIRKSPLGEILGRERMHFSLEMAVAKYLESAAPASLV